MTARLRILSAGAHTTVQDMGRPGFGRFGVPVSGAADPVSLRLVNALVGNAQAAAALEMRLFGPTVKCDGAPVGVAVAGFFSGHVTRAATGEDQPCVPWQSLLLLPGDILTLRQTSPGLTGYLSIAGGIDIPCVLGSRSGYARARLGGLADGKALSAGDVLPVTAFSASDFQTLRADTAELFTEAPLRVIWGPQDDFFSHSDKQMFLSASYTVSPAADRMGLRLDGPALRGTQSRTMISDGLVAGAVQIPGNGLPILLGVDCQTLGGYPKIATVISADRHRLGQLQPGDRLRFQAVDLAAARRAARALEVRIARIIAGISRYHPPGSVDEQALYRHNLIGGVVNALNSCS